MDELREQVAFVEQFGVEVTLLVDPSQVELELAILEQGFDCAFSPITRCYDCRDDGKIVPRNYDIYATFERLDQAFVGSDYFVSLLVDDKTLAGGRHGLAPPGLLVTRRLMAERPLVVRSRLADLTYPLIIKPNSLGGSLGIDAQAVVDDTDGAMQRLEFIFERFAPMDEVRVEHYIVGAREFTVAVLGNEEAVATSVTEILKPDARVAVFSEADKRARGNERSVRYGTVEDGVLRGLLAGAAHEAFRRFRLKDLARFDMLLKDRVYIIDVNVPPVLSNSFSHEWQQLYGTRRTDLLAFALAAFDQRLARESKPSRVPASLLAHVPPIIRRALFPLANVGWRTPSA